jgi:cystathionine gamma-synthase
MHFDTLAVRAGGEPDAQTGALAPPLHLSTTFEHAPDGGFLHGFVYVRHGSPTQTRLEQALAAVEGGQAALAFASGLAASAAWLQALPAGAHVLLHRDVYFDLRTMAAEYGPRWGLRAELADLRDLDAVRAALRPETRLLWAESPSNPCLDVLDLAALAEIAHAAGARLLVDSTFAPPAVQRPLELGADVVLHSTTKYLGGHSDVQGGALITRAADDIWERVHHARQVLGGVASPFNSWLVLRGLRTLACRVERQAHSALVLARALEGHPALAHVLYPGLESHPGHAVARRQMRAFGGMLTLRLRDGRAAALRAAGRLRLFTNATSLGGVESLVEHRASIEGAGSPTPDDLLRLSIGLEHPDDLLADLRQALDYAPR